MHIAFLNHNNIIYNLQFGFRQHYFTSRALIYITGNIRKALDGGNIGSRVFVNLQKTFDTVDQQILLAKLNNYEICRVSHDWLKSCLSNCNQYVSISCYDTGLAAVNCGLPQGSVLESLLFLLYGHVQNSVHGMWTFKKCKKFIFLNNSWNIYWIVMKISHDLSNGDTNGMPTSKSNKFSQGLR